MDLILANIVAIIENRIGEENLISPKSNTNFIKKLITINYMDLRDSRTKSKSELSNMTNRDKELESQLHYFIDNEC
jgi:hypothetical protein